MKADTEIWREITTKETGVNKATLSRVRAGLEGLSARSARKAAAASDETAVGLYAASQAHSIKTRHDAGQLDAGQVLGAVGRAFSVLKEDFGQDRADLDNDRLLREGIELLQLLGEKAAKNGARPTNQLERLG